MKTCFCRRLPGHVRFQRNWNHSSVSVFQNEAAPQLTEFINYSDNPVTISLENGTFQGADGNFKTNGYWNTEMTIPKQGSVYAQKFISTTQGFGKVTTFINGKEYKSDTFSDPNVHYAAIIFHDDSKIKEILKEEWCDSENRFLGVDSKSPFMWSRFPVHRSIRTTPNAGPAVFSCTM